MAARPLSFLNPRLAARLHPDKGGWGIFAVEPVSKGDLLLVWTGAIATYEQMMTLSVERRRHSIQVEEGLYQVPIQGAEPADYVNHSCNPNAGMSGQIALVAMRDIDAGEEVCMDYAMCDGAPYDEFDCHCGEPVCRGRVTGKDWSLPELQERYQGYFSPYLQRRIDRQLPVALPVADRRSVERASQRFPVDKNKRSKFPL